MRISAWFKTTTAGGVLIGNSTTVFGAATPQDMFPIVYIGKGGRLRNSLGSASQYAVTGGRWNHVDLVLSEYQGMKTSELVLDGQWMAERANAFSVDTTATFSIGAGPSESVWTSAPSGTWSCFKGQIGHLSIADMTWSPYAAGSAWRLNSITDPAGRTAGQVTYDDNGGGEARSVQDRNGGWWRIGEPATDAGTGSWLDQEQSEYNRQAHRYADSGWLADETGPSTTSGLLPDYWFDDWGTTQSGPFGEPTAELPRNHGYVDGSYVSGARTTSLEMWFKTSATGGGVLLATGEGHSNLSPGESVPVLYLGADGRLRGRASDGQASLITSAGPVNDGNWHHVVLTTSTSAQALYLDGSAGASIGNCSPGKYNPFVCWALDPSSLGDIVMLCNLDAQKCLVPLHAPVHLRVRLPRPVVVLRTESARPARHGLPGTIMVGCHYQMWNDASRNLTRSCARSRNARST